MHYFCSFLAHSIATYWWVKSDSFCRNYALHQKAQIFLTYLPHRNQITCTISVKFTGFYATLLCTGQWRIQKLLVGMTGVWGRAPCGPLVCVWGWSLLTAEHLTFYSILPVPCGARAASIPPFSSCPFASSYFSLIYFSLSFIGLVIFFFCPSLPFLPNSPTLFPGRWS